MDPYKRYQASEIPGTPEPISFRRLIVHLSDHVGHQHIPVYDVATDIHEFIAADAVHHDLVKHTVREIYRGNRCGYLDAPVRTTATFNALGKVRRRLLASSKADIDQINLVDAIGWAARDLFNQVATDSADTAVASATVIPFPAR